MGMTGMWTLQRRPKRMITTAALSMLAGLCMVGFYSWQVSTTVDCSSIPPTVDPNARKSSNWESDPDLCKLDHSFSDDSINNSYLFVNRQLETGVRYPVHHIGMFGHRQQHFPGGQSFDSHRR